jgi:hypothetical protein
MNRPLLLSYLLLLLTAVTGCRKEENGLDSTVFFRLFTSDTSFQTLGAFPLGNENYILYGATPEDNENPTVVIQTDLRGNIIRMIPLPVELQYCTIHPTPHGTLKIVGVPSISGTSIFVSELVDFNLQPVQEYPVDEEILSGPLLAPRFLMDDVSGEMFIALTSVMNDLAVPAVLRIDANGNLVSFTQYATGDTLNYMMRSFVRYQDGFILCGSSYFVNETSPTVRSYCLRVNASLEKEWCTIISKRDTFVMVKGAIPETNSVSCILYGSLLTNFSGNFQNNGFSDLIGTLFTQQIDLNGDTNSSIEYYSYENLAHAAEMIPVDGGYLLGATTNELTDYHVVSSNRIYLLRLDGTRHEMWHHEFNGFAPFTAISLAQTIDGGTLIGSFEHTGTWLYNMCLLKTDRNGNIAAD